MKITKAEQKLMVKCTCCGAILDKCADCGVRMHIWLTSRPVVKEIGCVTQKKHLCHVCVDYRRRQK